jgi:hypothetical protein
LPQSLQQCEQTTTFDLFDDMHFLKAFDNNLDEIFIEKCDKQVNHVEDSTVCEVFRDIH